MRSVLVLTLSLGIALPPAASAEVVIRPHDPAAAERPSRLQPTRSGSLDVPAEKIDRPAGSLIVPFFEVDTRDPYGTTTLFAVRTTWDYWDVYTAYYFSPSGLLSQADDFELEPGETFTRNVRDVSDLPTDRFGIAHGYIEILCSSCGDILVGDFLQVDPGNNFATGDRMVSRDDLCTKLEVRFMDFGLPTKLRFWIDEPLGADPDNDRPTMTLRPLDEQGNGLPKLHVFTDQHALSIDASQFSTERFGTVVVEFHRKDPVNYVKGWVYAEYAAENRYSVGMNGACIDR